MCETSIYDFHVRRKFPYITAQFRKYSVATERIYGSLLCTHPYLNNPTLHCPIVAFDVSHFRRCRAMDPLQHSHSLQLGRELWAKVFAYLEDRPGPIRPVTAQWQQQSEVHRPKLVCKQFRETYSSHPEIVQALYLNSDVTVGSLPSCWLGYNRTKAQSKHFEQNQEAHWCKQC